MWLRLFVCARDRECVCPCVWLRRQAGACGRGFCVWVVADRMLPYALPWCVGLVHAQASLLDQYEYGMSGRVFQYDYKAERRVDIFVSFGGLLMLLQGGQLPLRNIEQDQPVYFLARKAAV